MLGVVVRETHLGVIESKQVHDRRLKIVRGDQLFNGLVPELVGLSKRHPALDTTSGEPNTEPLAIVIPASPFGTAVILGHRQTTYLSAPVDQCGIEQASLLEVRN